jgi:hypothetical protein
MSFGVSKPTGSSEGVENRPNSLEFLRCAVLAISLDLKLMWGCSVLTGPCSDDNTSSGTTDGKTYSIATLWNYARQYALAYNFFASAMNSEPANMFYMIAATVHDDLTASGAPYFDHCSAEDVAESGGTIAQPLTETNVGDQLNANKVSWV